MDFIGTIAYLYRDFWNESSDSRINFMPFMNGGPWSMILVVFVLFMLSLKLSQWVKENKLQDKAKPLLLIYHAMFSGPYTVALIIAPIIKVHELCFNCDYVDLTDTSNWIMMRLYLVYICFAMSIAEILCVTYPLIFNVDSRSSLAQIFYNVFAPIKLYVHLKYHAGGNSGFSLMSNILTSQILYSHRILDITEFIPRKWSWFIDFWFIFQAVANIGHNIYGIMTPNCHWPFYVYVPELIFAFSILLLSVNKQKLLSKIKLQ